MTDGIIKGTGDSRYLKTVADAMALYPTYESFIQALASGTLPIDLNGINTAGWTQQGTPLNKANLLSDDTAAALGLTGDPTVNEALLSLDTAIANAIASSGKVATGQYVGAGTYGANNPKTLNFSFKPMLVFITEAATQYYTMGFTNDLDGSTRTMFAVCGAAQGYRMSNYGITQSAVVAMTDNFTWGDTSFTWYTTFSINSTIVSSAIDGTSQLNRSGVTYRYVAIGG